MIDRIRIRVSPAPLAWAILAAEGGAFFAGAGVVVAVTLLLRLFSVPSDSVAPRANDVAEIATIGVGIAVAFAAGGRYAAAAYASLAVIGDLLQLATQLRFCAVIFPAPPACSLGGYVGSLIPLALGAGLAYLLVRYVEAKPGSGNPLLEVAGALAIVHTVVFNVFAFAFNPSSELAAGLVQLLVLVGAGLLCGWVLLLRVEEPRRWPALAIVAMVSLGEWAVVSLVAYLGQTGVGGGIAVSGLNLIVLFAPFVELGCAALMLYLDAARRVTSPASS